MRITELTIHKIDRYSTSATELMGNVTLEGQNGKQEIRLTPGSLAQIFKVIRSQVTETASANAALTRNALVDAEASATLLETSTVELLA